MQLEQLQINKITVCGAVYAPKHLLRNEDMELVRKELTIESKYGDAPVYAYQERADWIVVPRFWFGRRLGHKYRQFIVNRDPPVTRRKWKFHGTLRKHQSNPKPGYTATPALAELILNHKGVFAEGPCGSGKTISAIYAISMLGMRTIIVTPNEEVRKQWLAALAKFLPEARVTVYGGPKAKKRRDLTGDIVVASLQLLSMLPEPLDEGFALYIMDECHMAAAPMYQKAMFNVPYRYALALSATGDRFDGMDKLFRYCLSTTSVKLDTDQMTITCVLKPFEHDTIEKRRLERIVAMNIDKELAHNQRRNIKLVEYVRAAYHNDRKIIVLGKDLLQLRILRDVFQAMEPYALTSIMAGEITRNGKKVDDLARSPAQRKLDEQNKNDPNAVVFATYKMLGTGYDAPEKDVLICASFLLDCRQAIGRVQRRLKGKPLPLALILVDDLKQLKRRIAGSYYGALAPLGKDRCKVVNECAYLRGALKGSNIRHADAA